MHFDGIRAWESSPFFAWLRHWNGIHWNLSERGRRRRRCKRIYRHKTKMSSIIYEWICNSIKANISIYLRMWRDGTTIFTCPLFHHLFLSTILGLVQFHNVNIFLHIPRNDDMKIRFTAHTHRRPSLSGMMDSMHVDLQMKCKHDIRMSVFR